MTDSSDQGGDPAGNWVPRGIDTQTPSTARMYDYYLGGKHHYAADRDAAQSVLAAVPDITVAVREFDGFDFLEPGIVPVQEWRNVPTTAERPKATAVAGLGYKI